MISIRDYAFYNCASLTSVEIPSSTQTIGYYAFGKNTALTTLVLNEGLMYINSSAFTDCQSLTSLTLPSTVKRIGNQAFYNNINLVTVSLNEGLTEIQPYAFYYCSALNSIEIPSTVSTIGEYAFYNTGLTSIVNHAPINWNWYTITRKGSSVTCDYTTDTCTYGGITVTNDIAS